MKKSWTFSNLHPAGKSSICRIVPAFWWQLTFLVFPYFLYVVKISIQLVFEKIRHGWGALTILSVIVLIKPQLFLLLQSPNISSEPAVPHQWCCMSERQTTTQHNTCSITGEWPGIQPAELTEMKGHVKIPWDIRVTCKLLLQINTMNAQDCWRGQASLSKWCKQTRLSVWNEQTSLCVKRTNKSLCQVNGGDKSVTTFPFVRQVHGHWAITPNSHTDNLTSSLSGTNLPPFFLSISAAKKCVYCPQPNYASHSCERAGYSRYIASME